jgi:hypothetical protein
MMQALKRHKQSMGKRYIEVFPSCLAELQQAMLVPKPGCAAAVVQDGPEQLLLAGRAPGGGGPLPAAAWGAHHQQQLLAAQQAQVQAAAAQQQGGQQAQQLQQLQAQLQQMQFASLQGGQSMQGGCGRQGLLFAVPCGMQVQGQFAQPAPQQPRQFQQPAPPPPPQQQQQQQQQVVVVALGGGMLGLPALSLASNVASWVPSLGGSSNMFTGPGGLTSSSSMMSSMPGYYSSSSGGGMFAMVPAAGTTPPPPPAGLAGAGGAGASGCGEAPLPDMQYVPFFSSGPSQLDSLLATDQRSGGASTGAGQQHLAFGQQVQLVRSVPCTAIASPTAAQQRLAPACAVVGSSLALVHSAGSALDSGLSGACLPAAMPAGALGVPQPADAAAMLHVYGSGGLPATPGMHVPQL